MRVPVVPRFLEGYLPDEFCVTCFTSRASHRTIKIFLAGNHQKSVEHWNIGT